MSALAFGDAKKRLPEALVSPSRRKSESCSSKRLRRTAQLTVEPIRDNLQNIAVAPLAPQLSEELLAFVQLVHRRKLLVQVLAA